MGLKKLDYIIEENGLLLPEAYAYVRSIRIDGDKGVAEISVQSSREKAINLVALKTVRIEFYVNRNENPFVTVYNLAKSEVEVRISEDIVEKVKMPFYGWEDDINEENLL